ncbi:MAG TPA: YlbF family regulator [Bacillales bacterium]|nr:YlbF family regulator [Bacillales bacterium]
MEKYSRVEIIGKAKQLARMISETEEVEFFQKAEQQINENEKVSGLIAQIKLKQKEAVNLQHFGKHEALKKVEAEIDELTDELEGIPIVQEFKDSQSRINQLLQLISKTISNTVTEEIIKASESNETKLDLKS